MSGGGGGGYYGGAGGSACEVAGYGDEPHGGGGGSAYVGGCVAGTAFTVAGKTATNGTSTLPGNSGNALYQKGVGIGARGGATSPGGSGLVVISYTKTTSIVTYNCTNDMRTFTAPAHVTSVGVTATGASGASNGGFGGVVRTTLTVTPGATYYVVVGCQGVGMDGGYNVSMNFVFVVSLFSSFASAHRHLVW